MPFAVTVSGKNEDYLVRSSCAKPVSHQQTTFVQSHIEGWFRQLLCQWTTLYDAKKNRYPCLQKCCSLTLKEGLRTPSHFSCTFPTISCSFPAIYRNWVGVSPPIPSALVLPLFMLTHIHPAHLLSTGACCIFWLMAAIACRGLPTALDYRLGFRPCRWPAYLNPLGQTQSR